MRTCGRIRLRRKFFVEPGLPSSELWGRAVGCPAHSRGLSRSRLSNSVQIVPLKPLIKKFNDASHNSSTCHHSYSSFGRTSYEIRYDLLHNEDDAESHTIAIIAIGESRRSVNMTGLVLYNTLHENEKEKKSCDRNATAGRIVRFF